MEPVAFESKKFLIVIAGPTASGKTALALSVAQRYRCDIFSADSRQIYNEMDIGTAKPTKDEMTLVRHHFVDCKELSALYDVGQYIEDLNQALNHYFQDHSVAVMAGGSGLYIHAFLNGLDDFPEVPEDITSQIQTVWTEQGISALQTWLKELDPIYYERVDLFNPRRLIRAISICLSSGRPYSSFLNGRKDPPERLYEIIPILLQPDRTVLYELINKRVDRMIDQGWIEEARFLYDKRHLRSLDTVGYKELFQYIEGSMTLPEAIEKIKINTRRYAKRQMTWFNKYGQWHIFKNTRQDDILQWLDEKIMKD